ncbi:MAG: hypothetical protein AAF657_22310 [Acidobacteriota bacterium]
MADQETPEIEAEALPAEAPAPATPRLEPQYAQQSIPRENPSTVRNPLLAGFFSIFPGLGNVYNGLYLRGVTMFMIFFGLAGLAAGTEPPEAVILVFSVIFTWLFNIFDAYRQATLINFGYTPDVQLPEKSRIPTWGSGGMIAGVAVFVIGFYGFLRERFDIDLTVLLDYWYLIFMAFGAFLIAQTVMEKRKADEAGDEDESAELT